MQVKANGVSLECELFGAARDPVIILINGLGSQMINYTPDFCRMIVEKGFQVLRFDNRDVGLSEKFDGMTVPSPGEIIHDLKSDEKPNLPYYLEDMAGDVIGLMDVLDFGKAHIAGMSMGGMIAQHVAIHHGPRLQSMTSIMSTTGSPDVPPATEEAMTALRSRAEGADREAIIRHGIKCGRVYESPAWPLSEERAWERYAAMYDRCHYPEGTDRQYAAVLADGDRSARLANVSVPTLVIHGKEDPLVRVEGGIDTAEKIPGARLEVIEGMGHNLPFEILPHMTDLIAGHAKSV